jgi:hypothetical protein
MPVAGQRVKALDFSASASATDSTTQSTTTTPAAGTPSVNVTFVAPTSGKALIIVSGAAQDVTVTNTAVVDTELRLTNVGGTIIFATGAFDRRLQLTLTASGNSLGSGSRTWTATGLTPGATYFLRTMHYAATGTTCNIINRRLDVVPLAA